jgi:hypothetical protein
MQVTLDANSAAGYLAWSDQFKPDFDLIREALKRPYARMDGDYSKPYEQPIPNFVNVRNVAQVLAQRAKCDLLLGQPDKALQELTLLHDMCRLLEAAPTGKPMTLVAAMINVAVTGLYVDTIAYGFQNHAWQEPQLTALQTQLKEINLTPFLMEAFQSEQASECHFFETMPQPKISSLFFHERFPGDKLTFRIFLMRLKNLVDLTSGPHGWIYQNMVTIAKFNQGVIDCIDLTNNLVMPQKIDNVQHELEMLEKHHGPYTFLAAIAIPNCAKAWQTDAHNQTLVNEAQISCALECFHLVHGNYPETLDALVPQFIEKLPHDVIGGQPLHYRRTEGGKFLLYSVGWNETDDGGKPGTLSDPEQGDWVWKN